MDMLLCCVLMTVTLASTWVKTVNPATLPSPTSWSERDEEAKSTPISDDYAYGHGAVYVGDYKNADDAEDGRREDDKNEDDAEDGRREDDKNEDDAEDGRHEDDDEDGRRDGNSTDRRIKSYERFIGEGASTEEKTVCTLRTYDADKDLAKIRQWHDLIKAPVDGATAMRQLLIESCEDAERFVMCNTFLFARRENKPCISGLTSAECLAVTMYSAEVAGGFYREFNNASSFGVWTPYRVFTSLLYSAVKKLAAIEPVPLDAKLYRGMSLPCHPPDAKRIFWKTFTSTTLDEEIAGYFGTSTSLVFEDQATLVGARIKNLSLIEMEDEVLIPPFEIFDFLRADKQTFYFSSSKKQDLLHDDPSHPHNEAHGPNEGSCSVQVPLLTMTLSGVISVIVLKSPF